jgi:hypothetical protein
MTSLEREFLMRSLALIIVTAFISIGCTTINKNTATTKNNQRSVASEVSTLTKLPVPPYNEADQIPRFFDRHVSRVAKLQNDDIYIDIAFSSQGESFGLLYIAFDHSSGNCRDASDYGADVYQVYINYPDIRSARLEGNTVVVTGQMFDPDAEDSNYTVENSFNITFSPNSAPLNVENAEGRIIRNCSGSLTPSIPASIVSNR